MIKFICKSCGQKINVEDKHSGKKVKCPKCDTVGIVPDKSDKITFQCENCGHTIRVSESYAGKKGKCLECSNPIVVPLIRRETPNKTKTFSVVCSMCEKSILVPETSRGKIIECPGCGSFIETFSETTMPNTSILQNTDEKFDNEESETTKESAKLNCRLKFLIVGFIMLSGFIILAIMTWFSHFNTKILLAVLCIINIPAFIIVWKLSFSRRWNFWECLTASFKPDFLYLMEGDWQGDPDYRLIFFLFLLVCSGIVFGEYSFLKWLVI